MSGYHHPFSPSRLAMREACPASYRMEAGEPDTQSDAAAEGSFLHSVVESRINGKAIEQLTCEQSELVDECLRQLPDRDEAMVYAEATRYLYGEDGCELTSGTIDATAITPGAVIDRVTIFDWKFGRSEVSDAADNIQMAAYAAMAAYFHGVEEVTAVVVQPRLRKVSRHTYRDLPAIVRHIEGIVRACNDPRAPANVGDHCKWCRGKAKCPAYVGDAIIPMEIADAPGALPSVPNWTDDELSTFKIRWGRLSALAKIVDSEIAIRCSKNGACGEYIAREVKGRAKIPDASAAWSRLADVMTPEAFAAAATVSLPQLAEAHKSTTGLSLRKAREAIEAILGDAVEPGKMSTRIAHSKGGEDEAND